MEITKLNNMNELVINYHITAKCNFSCNYCFAKWENNIPCRELHEDMDSLDSLARKIKPSLSDINIRINIAGGEPLLIKNVADVIKLFHAHGFQVGLITNGSRLNDQILKDIAPLLDILGISIDSNIEDINMSIGRCESTKTANINSLIHNCQQLKEINPHCRLKINTVVTRENITSNLNYLIATIKPYKWKIMQVVPFENKCYGISSFQFQQFIARHQTHEHIIQTETAEQITNSYLMLDPLGRFFYNSNNTYRYSEPILEAGFMNALNTVKFDQCKYISRYGHAKVS